MKISSPIDIVQKAVSNKCGYVYYTSASTNIGGGKVSKDKKENSYQVELITIDNFCNQNNIFPNFIKMNIEGAELDAILGASHVLAEYKPKFAISIYHKWSHRWEIALALKQILPDSNFT